MTKKKVTAFEEGSFNNLNLLNTIEQKNFLMFLFIAILSLKGYNDLDSCKQKSTKRLELDER